MQTSTIKTILAAGLAFCIIACNNSAKKDKKEKQADTAVAETPPAPPPGNPPKVEIKEVDKKCFVSEGLKYTAIITIGFGDNEVGGFAVSIDLETKRQERTTFTGVLNGDKLSIKFNGTPPVVGAASEWTDKAWTIKKTGNKETLHIIFNAKNYETNKWQDMDYEFQQADCK